MIHGFKSPKGSPQGAVRYLLGKKDAEGRPRQVVKILYGDPGDFIRAAHSKPRKGKAKSYSSAYIRKAEGDEWDDETKAALVQSWIEHAFPGVDPGDVAILAVDHGDDIHILAANVHLGDGKDLNPAPPGWEKHWQPWADYWNYGQGWEDPQTKLAERPAPFPVKKADGAEKRQVIEALNRWALQHPDADFSAVIREAEKFGEVKQLKRGLKINGTRFSADTFTPEGWERWKKGEARRQKADDPAAALAAAQELMQQRREQRWKRLWERHYRPPRKRGRKPKRGGNRRPEPEAPPLAEWLARPLKPPKDPTIKGAPDYEKPRRNSYRRVRGREKKLRRATQRTLKTAKRDRSEYAAISGGVLTAMERRAERHYHLIAYALNRARKNVVSADQHIEAAGKTIAAAGTNLESALVGAGRRQARRNSARVEAAIGANRQAFEDIGRAIARLQTAAEELGRKLDELETRMDNLMKEGAAPSSISPEEKAIRRIVSDALDVAEDPAEAADIVAGKVPPRAMQKFDIPAMIDQEIEARRQAEAAAKKAAEEAKEREEQERKAALAATIDRIEAEREQRNKEYWAKQAAGEIEKTETKVKPK
jgi:hypothetical protein